MSGWTRAFLILLRLAIGWHFLFEGLEKLNSDVWSSEAYLREASGPLAPWFWRMAGDRFAEQLRPQSRPEWDPAHTPPHDYFPAALDKEWRSYAGHFAKHYHLDDEQRRRAEGILLQQEDVTASWLLGRPPNGFKTITAASPYGPPVQIDKTTPRRLQDYEDKVKEIRTYQTKEFFWASGTAFTGEGNAKLIAAKSDVNRLRGELRSELNSRFEKLQDDLHALLTAEQLKMPPLAGRSLPRWRDWSGMRNWEWLDWIDRLIPLGLTAVGIGLLLGVFTRASCVAGALLLLSFYLAMPPLHGVPENPRAEGHYLYVNKNIIEMLALLTLATTRSGRWLGLDGLLQFLNPRRWRRAAV